MKYIIGIFITLDCIYQLFGVSSDVNWSIYYELVHYTTLAAVCIWYAYQNWNKLVGVFSLYFMAIIIVTISHIGSTQSEYLTMNNYSPVYWVVLFTIFIISIFLIQKKWGK